VEAPLNDASLNDALETCAGIVDLTDHLVVAFEAIGGMGRAGRDGEADAALAEASESLLLLVNACDGVAHALGSEAKPLRGVAGALQPWLGEMVAARERGDWVRLCDVLDYELCPRLRELGPSAQQVWQAVSPT